MAKQSENEVLSEEIVITTTTTTEAVTTTTTEAPKKIDLQNYLDELFLTRAERTYYERTYNQVLGLKTREEWQSEIKLVH